MATLADELAADLDFSDDDQQQGSDIDEEQEALNKKTEEIIEDEDMDQAGDTKSEKTSNSVRKIARLLDSKQTQDVLEKIDKYIARNRSASDVKGPAEEDEEYKLIVQSNSITADIDGEIQNVHKFIRDHYATRFPELETLVYNPIEYARTVKAIGTETELTKVDLRSILPSATVMVITVTASTTAGKPLSPEEWSLVEEACDMVLELDAARRKIMNYVESRMTVIAPNLSYVVGTSTAAKLLTAAGGLSAFCKIPACNVQVVGNDKKTNTGFSTAHMDRHSGYISYAEPVLAAPQDLKKKLVKIVAAKAALAARIDASHKSPQGQDGQKMREEIDAKIEKLQEAPALKVTKALPVPDEGPKKRRGGKRVRRQNQAYAMTELRAARNRMVFGEAEEEVGYGDETEGLGMTTKQVGKIRASAVDQRTKVKAPKLKSFSNRISGTATSGLASSLAFTPAQSMELVDPTAALEQTREKKMGKYFGDGAFSLYPKH
ncbi:U4/U6 small nuclear ribonucleoprotein Prp31 [Choanephora cucurbitarum]|uniref:U4/U6 small nuclear ribonucleoprotein Prp31 n=1 Tax=Choanephora cucurbitarum TaxID=101091 RepID=A0A1C7NLK4_9FUNG|nr:U4/U6 small nuclear ribonucleoprotein Prp31 [Choanephora cucurbitarum]